MKMSDKASENQERVNLGLASTEGENGDDERSKVGQFSVGQVGTGS